jgi:hypothetical protein
MSPARLRALRIIADEPGIRPREFAKKMWPDSDGWKRHSRSGPKGAHRGGGMYLTGGAFLGRLNNDGLTYHTNTYQYDTGHALTTAGERALEEAERDA